MSDAAQNPIQEKGPASPKRPFEAPLFPEYADNPEDWRRAPRVSKPSRFKPDRFPGTKNVAAHEQSGVIFLKMIGEALDLMILETNKHAESRNLSRKWKKLERPELATYLGLLLSMGAFPKQNYTMYWTDTGITATPHFKRHMSLARFKQITQNLHFEDEQVAQREGWDARGTDTRDAIYKIRRFWELCFEGFRCLRAPKRQNAVDEQVIPFEGQFPFKQCIPGKPHDTGVKVYALCESSTGYTLAGHIHTDEKFEFHEDGAILSRVMALVKEAGILHQNFELYTDSFYTTKALADILLKHGIYFCGTLASKRTVGVPPVVGNKKSKYSETLIRGQAVFLHSETTSICNWSDNNSVVFLYTISDVVEEFQNCKRRMSAQMVEQEGTYQVIQKDVPMPVIAQLYNLYMGGVDLADQLISNVVRYFRIRKWYKSVFNYLIMTACCNVYVIQKERIENMVRRKRFTVRLARTELGEQLLQIGNSASSMPQEIDMEDDFSLFKHHLVKRDRKLQCKGHKSRHRVITVCSGCSVNLCVECFVPYHSALKEKK